MLLGSGALAALGFYGARWAAAEGTGVNPPVGSIWTYLGATYGAAWQPPQYNATQLCTATTVYGAKGDGVTDNAAAFQAMFSDPNSPQVSLCPGTYYISCGHTFSAASAVSLIGSGRNNTTIRLGPPGTPCTESTDVFYWSNSTFTISGITFDVNNSTTAGTAIIHGATTVALTGPIIRAVSVINGARPGRLVALNTTTAAGSYTHTIIDDNYLGYTTAATATDNCVALAGWGAGDSITGGWFHGFSVSRNTCVNSSFQIDGDSGVVGYNDICCFAFGAGIFMSYNGTTTQPPPTSDHDNLIVGNVIHDSAVGTDVNNTTAAGIENNCYRCIITNNILHHLGGEGLRNYGEYTQILNNKIFDNGKTTTLGGNYLPAGINLANGGREPYMLKTITLAGNHVYDDGAHTQAYGVVYNYGGAAYDPALAIKSSNDIQGDPTLSFTVSGVAAPGTAFVDMFPAATQLASGYVLIEWQLLSLQAANYGSGTIPAALSFFPIDTQAWHSFKLACHDIVPQLLTPVAIQLGTGTGPTWQTTGYAVQQIYTAASVALSSYGYTGGTAMQIGPYNADSAGGWPTSFEVNVGDLLIARPRRLFNITAVGLSGGAGGGAVTVNGVGYWDSAAAVTGIRLLAPAGGGIAGGYCSLWGR